MLEDLFGSKTKSKILLYLGLRGGASGRRISRVLNIPPTQIFKALRGLQRSEIIKRDQKNHFYYLNPQYLFYEEILQMVQKEAEISPKSFRLFLAPIDPERKIDPFSIFEFISLRGKPPPHQKFSDILRKRYA